jgi:hypothetical protein
MHDIFNEQRRKTGSFLDKIQPVIRSKNLNRRIKFTMKIMIKNISVHGDPFEVRVDWITSSTVSNVFTRATESQVDGNATPIDWRKR